MFDEKKRQCSPPDGVIHLVQNGDRKEEKNGARLTS